MGTNYYLHKKVNFDPKHRIPASLGCDDGHEYEPIELENGWVWHNKYYPTLDELNKEFYQEIHIGKSSCGWRFGLCIYPAENPRFKGESWNDKYLDKPISSLGDWEELFDDPDNSIWDEYGDEVSKDDMVACIANRKPRESLRDGWQRLNEGTEFETKEEYFAINGLLVHERTRPSPHWLDAHRDTYTTIMPDDCTYDLILSGNDVESGEIFC